jgi:hypothetical protein
MGDARARPGRETLTERTRRRSQHLHGDAFGYSSFKRSALDMFSQIVGVQVMPSLYAGSWINRKLG